MDTKRIKKIKKYCKNKSVLDIGCVDHSAITEKNNIWLHKKIKSVAKNLTGLDYEKEEVNKLNKLSYNIIYGDAENFNLKKEFEVIVCGELIEHLFNPGNFLDSVKLHMNEKSILIMTTPNAFSFRRMIGSILFGSLNENCEHVSYYSDTTIRQLLKRKGFKNIKIEYLESEDTNWYKLFIEKFINIFTRKSNRTVLFIIAKKG